MIFDFKRGSDLQKSLIVALDELGLEYVTVTGQNIVITVVSNISAETARQLGDLHAKCLLQVT